MTARPVPAKLTAVEGLVSAILAQAGNVNHLTTPAGAHVTLQHHADHLRATAPCVTCGVRRHLDDLQPVEDVTCHMIPGDYECVDTAACKTAQKGDREGTELCRHVRARIDDFGTCHCPSCGSVWSA